jgi:4-amino-4-deoxy-L-arabinose transferase-like glycosyltransferase
MRFKELHWSQRFAYSLVAVTFLTTPIHFVLPRDSEFHALPIIACLLLLLGCMVLGFQTQPREMRPALLAFLAMWVHVGVAVLSQR